jgi:DNA-binding CsgD family transcriptional regulator
MLLVHSASTLMLSSEVVGSLALVRRACALAERGDGTSTMPASLMLAFLCLHHGDTAEFEVLFPPLSALADQLKDTDDPYIDLFLQLVGMVHVYTEQWDTGRVYLTAVAHRAGRRARFATAALASATLAELCWRSGRWEEAHTLATSELVGEVTLTGARLWLLAFTAHIEAGFGRAAECRAAAQAALAESEPMGFGTAIMWACHALGQLELGFGHAVAAASYLDRIDVMASAHEIVEPCGVWWQADHIEALIRSGRPHEAAHALARFESSAERSPRLWAAATAARCRALMAPTAEQAEECFEIALAHHDRLAAPYELGRTLLCRAERRVATGSTLDSSADLDEAIAIFDALGAASWSAQGCALRDAMTARDQPNLDELLSPAERRVAEAVVDGLTNKEVAALLFVSEKTVEFHLHNVYRKLAVRSRSQLVRRFPKA